MKILGNTRILILKFLSLVVIMFIIIFSDSHRVKRQRNDTSSYHVSPIIILFYSTKLVDGKGGKPCAIAEIFAAVTRAISVKASLVKKA